MKSVRAHEKISPKTYAFWAEYEDMISSMMKYAKENNVVLSLRVDGKNDNNGNQIWLNHEEYGYKYSKSENIVMFTSGMIDGKLSEDVYVYAEARK